MPMEMFVTAKQQLSESTSALTQPLIFVGTMRIAGLWRRASISCTASLT